MAEADDPKKPEDEVEESLRRFGEFVKETFREASPGDRLMTWTNFVLIFIGSVAALIYGCQLEQMRVSNSATKQAMHDSNRAWIGLAKITPVSFEKGADVESDSVFLFTVTFGLKNYGHSVAQHVRIFPQLDVADSSNTTSGVCNDSNAGKYLGDVILPEQAPDASFGVRITVANMESALKRQNPGMKRNLILILRGCTEYVDDLGENPPHHTPFSYFVTRNGKDRYFTPDVQSVLGTDINLTPAILDPGPAN